MRTPLSFSLEPTRSGRSLAGLLASLGAHALLATLAIFAAQGSAQPVAPRESQPRLIEIPPLPPMSPPERRPPPVSSVEPAPRRVPRPQVIRGRPLPDEITIRPVPPPEQVLDEPPVAAAPAPPASAPDPVPPSPPTDLVAAREAEMRSEAQRLFGPRRLGSERPPGPVSTNWVNQLTDDRDNDCKPVVREPRDPSQPPELGTVSGRVFRAGTSQPLPGAYLQILGTPYATFADDAGDYTLEFDRSLVDGCRTQYVQVSKDGFAPQRLILSLGSRTSNDIPMTRR